MEGYILKISPVREEDTIVTLLTQHQLYTLYRFYGARHSPITLGYKIDCTIEPQIGYLPKMRHLVHLGPKWVGDWEKMVFWQRWIGFLGRHLRGVGTIEPFYYQLLERLTRKIERQEVKRALVEGHIALLRFEGRGERELWRPFWRSITGQGPSPNPGRLQRALEHLLTYTDSQYLTDKEVELLYTLLLEWD
ncbi:MAG: recombination protein RecO [Nitratiruptor sp.]|nr:recombination protein RecO [Nitratiruptor sp.]NPA83988.1 recombination protein RecO [Campylobacterota bacterium]